MLEHLGHDLFLLMLNLSQLRDPERTKALFVESMNALQDRIRLRILAEGELSQAETVPIATTGRLFGRMELARVEDALATGDAREMLSLVRNAVGMLAVVLENQMQALLLSDENLLLESLVQQRTADLKASEARFRSTFEQAAVGITHVSPDGRFLRVNRRFCEIVGRTVDEMLALRFMDITHPDDVDQHLVYFQRALIGDLEAYALEKRYLRPDGTIVWVNLTVSFVLAADGGSHYFICVVEDITERKRAEAQLRESEERFRNVSELISDFVYSVRIHPDHTVQIEWITEAFAQLTGYGVEEAEALGRLEAITFPDDRALIRKRMIQLLAGQEAVTEYRMITREGGPRWVRDYGRPVSQVLPDGSRRVLGAAQDITERKLAEAKLAAYQEQLEELVEARTAELVTANQELRQLTQIKDEFVANVSHELRTPITNLVLREHLMRRQPDEWQRHLVVIERETQRLAHTINDLLLLSRMDRERVQVHTEWIDLNELAQQYVYDRESLADDHGLTLTLHRMEGVPPIEADPGLLGQAVSILLTNAFNYTPPGERIMVSVSARRVNGQPWAGITVGDTGVGIPLHEQPRLFERFFRGGVARTSGTPGTGLGLAILKGIIEQHAGEVDVESSGIPGEGSRFTIWLPVREPSGHAPRE